MEEQALKNYPVTQKILLLPTRVIVRKEVFVLNKIASQLKETLETILHYFLCIEKETFFPKLGTILKATMMWLWRAWDRDLICSLLSHSHNAIRFFFILFIYFVLVGGGYLYKNNTRHLLLGLYHASANWISIVLMQVTPQNELSVGICENSDDVWWSGKRSVQQYLCWFVNRCFQENFEQAALPSFVNNSLPRVFSLTWSVTLF